MFALNQVDMDLQSSMGSLIELLVLHHDGNLFQPPAFSNIRGLLGQSKIVTIFQNQRGMAATGSFLRSFLHFKTQKLSKASWKCNETVGNTGASHAKTHHTLPWTLQRWLTWCQPKSAACIARPEDATNTDKVNQVRPKFRPLSAKMTARIEVKAERSDLLTCPSQSSWNRNWNPQKSSTWVCLSSGLEWFPTSARKFHCNLHAFRNLNGSTATESQQPQNLNSYMDSIWRFPEMGLPPNHPFWTDLPLRRIQLLGYTTHLWKPPYGFQTSLASRRCRSCKVALALSGNTFLTFLSPHFDSDMKSISCESWRAQTACLVLCHSDANHNKSSIC